ncbi:MAG: glycosyltransferase family 4 protein [Verrucomicrobiota bacterium]
MKILLLNLLYPPDGIGGSEKSTQYLATGLHDLGHDVHVVAQAISEETVMENTNNVRVTRVGSPPGYQPNVFALPKEHIQALKEAHSGDFIPFSESVAQIIEDESPDIVHCNVVPRPGDIWNYCKRKKIPVVQTLRSYSIMCSARMIQGGRNCMSWCDPCRDQYKNRIDASAHVDAVVGISEHVLNTFLFNGFFSESRFAEVIPNSYHAERMSPLPVLGNRGECIMIGYLGRIHQSKGIETVLDAFARKTTSRLVLKIAGSGNPDYISYLTSKYRSEFISFVGYVDPQDFVNEIDVMCMPSTWHEPFGRVNIEAIAHGRPVIAAKRGGVTAIIKDGITGWHYEPYSVSQLSGIFSSIATMDPDQWESLFENCLKDAHGYSVRAVAEAYEDLYYNLQYPQVTVN